MDSNILLNEASHFDEASWGSLIGGIGANDNCNEFTCNNGFTCNVFDNCKVKGILSPGCIVHKETGKLISNNPLPMSIASLNF